MIPPGSMAFLVVLLLILNLLLIFLMLVFVRRVRRMGRAWADFAAEQRDTGELNAAAQDAAELSAKEVAGQLSPLMEASRDAAREFDQLIREKKKLTQRLNQALDSKMISLNLLLTRAETLHKKLETLVSKACSAQAAPVNTGTAPARALDVVDQQNQILDLYYQKMDVDTIAEELSIPKGEVKLVVDLKEKFMAMEQNS